MEDILRDYQREALNKMKNGCILNGGVGSGKSITGLYYYFKEQGGCMDGVVDKDMENPKDLYIITTAMKRDRKEWDAELARYSLSTDPELSHYDNKVVVDSWNNIGKYMRVKDAFFLFDEDKVTGDGKWAKTFIHISKNNDWIILSATSGDCWMDYMSVFIANGFYRNKTDFKDTHVEYDRFCTKFPKIKSYRNTGRLMRLRNKILIGMDSPNRPAVRHNVDVWCSYNRWNYKDLFKTRWNYDKDAPIENASELCYQARKLVNSDIDRVNKFVDLIQTIRRAIVFYNFDYELEILKSVLEDCDIPYAEWNGHTHQEIPPEEDRWCYLVQYNAGAEAWNCIETNVIIFFSQNYSYKIVEQASGRIDRMNTPFTDLYYYHMKSHAPIDVAIYQALTKKKLFNETRFVGKVEEDEDYIKVA